MRLIFALFVFISTTCFSQGTAPEKELRTLVTLLDYIAKDYSAAVENGQIINEFEYAEMSEFSEKCITLHTELSASIRNERFEALQAPLLELKDAVAQKASAEDISRFAISTRNKILDLGMLKISPASFPSVRNGLKLYSANCASCHGEKGFGDGHAGRGLDPPPGNFHEAEISPVQAYNVIKLGIEGTGMVSYAHLSEKELWDLAFYIQSLKHPPEKIGKDISGKINLDSISRWTDAELESFLKREGNGLTVAQVRHFEPERPDPVTVAREYLENSYAAFREGNTKGAESLALASYLEGFELVENLLNASSSRLVQDIERDMIEYRKAIEQNDTEKVKRYYEILLGEIDEAGELLQNKDYSFGFIYGAALSILIREALEALLVILVILGILRPMKVRKAVTAVHIGWVSALLLGLACWFFVDALINLSGASRELMEGTGALLAVVVLLFAGVWLHSHSEITKWTQFVKTRIQGISDKGNWIGLSLFSFVIVFREAIEVVLFLSSLKLSKPEVAGSAINWALLTSVAIVALIAVVFLKFTKKLPLGTFFKLAAFMVAVLAVVLAGKGVMAFQEAGIIPVKPLCFIPRVDVLGIYPNWQVFLTQVLVIGIIIFFRIRTRLQSNGKA